MSALKNRILRNTVALAAGGVLAQIAFLAVEGLIARRLGEAGYGVFSTVYAISLASLFLIDLGTTWKLIQDGARDESRLPQLLGTTLLLKLALFIVVYPATWGLLVLAGYDAVTIGFFGVFFWFALSLALQDSFTGVYAARQRMHVNALFQSLVPVIVLLLMVVLTARGATLAEVALAYVGGSAVVTCLWGWLTFRETRPRPAPAAIPPLVAGSWLYGVSSLCSHVFTKLPILMLSLLRDMAEVGIYAAGAKLLDLANKIPVLLSRVLAPGLFKQSHADRAAHRAACALLIRYAAVAAVSTAMLLFVAAETLIGQIFGDAYRDAVPILQILAVSFAFRFLSVTIEMVLSTADRHAQRARSVATATVIHAILSASAIPLWGAIGAAAAMLISELLLLCLYFRAAQAVIGRAATTRAIAGPLALAAGTVALVEGLAGADPTGASVLLTAPGAVLVLFALLVLTRYVRLRELRLLLAAPS